MGWNIDLVKNTVKIDSQIAMALYNCAAQVTSAWQDECNLPMLEGIIYGGKLVFNPDHMEHMDYVWEPEVLEVLCTAKVQGDICFSSHAGDNKGKSWGYRFDGMGGQVDLALRKGKWVETGKSQARGTGVLTCMQCGGLESNLVSEGKERLNVRRCTGCNSKDMVFVYPFPGGKYVKPVAQAAAAQPGWRVGVRATIENEGFDYAFRLYSEFRQVEDKRFHELRKAYLAAAEALQSYVGSSDDE